MGYRAYLQNLGKGATKRDKEIFPLACLAETPVRAYYSTDKK
jgi:hypothetical protein